MNHQIARSVAANDRGRTDIDTAKLNALILQRDLAATQLQGVLNMRHEAREQFEGAWIRLTAVANEHGRLLAGVRPNFDALLRLTPDELTAGRLDITLIREAQREHALMAELGARADALHAAFSPLDAVTKACVAYAAERPAP